MTGEKSEIYALLITLGIALGGMIIGRIVFFIGHKYLKKIFEKTETQLDDKVLKILSGFVNPLFFFIAFDISFYFVKHSGSEKIINVLTNINEIVIILIVAVLISKIMNAVFDELPVIEAKSKKEKKRNVAVIVPILKNFGIIVIFIIATSMIVIKLGYSPVSILTGMGIAGVAVSFAAQSTIANFLSGIFILFDV